MIRKEMSKTPFAIYWWFLQVVVVLGLASLVVWQSLIPRSPSFIIADVFVPASNSTNSTVHRSEVVAKNTSPIFILQISNPNKGMGIYYNDINITLYRNDATIGAQSVPAFYQGHKKSLLCNVQINSDQHFWRAMANGVVDLRLFLETAVKYQIFKWKTKHHQIVRESFVRIDQQGKIYGKKNIKLTENGD